MPRSYAGTSCHSHHSPCSSLSSCWVSLAWQGQGQLLQVTLSCHITLQVHTWLAAGAGVDCPPGPAHSRGWSVRAASHQGCLSEEQGLSSLWERSSGHPGAWRGSAGPRALQHCSLNIPSGAQLGVTLGPSLGRVWRFYEPLLSLSVRVC